MLRSPPSRRRGLKFCHNYHPKCKHTVASFAEAWIEIVEPFTNFHAIKSPPSRRRGLKLISNQTIWVRFPVASFAEAWIEILMPLSLLKSISVASFAEAWIEIILAFDAFSISKSPPSRRRGLK